MTVMCFKSVAMTHVYKCLIEHVIFDCIKLISIHTLAMRLSTDIFYFQFFQIEFIYMEGW